jgi:hydroxymethylbilane synthase
MKLRIATRQSPLALAQTRWITKLLLASDESLEIEELLITTQGDQRQDEALWQVSGKALFVSELETAILEDRADIAVHSMKDLPSVLADGLQIACVPSREDPRDALIARDGTELEGLEAGSKVGTSSLRRMVQLRRVRPDLNYVPIRGNVDTRLRKLDQGDYAAIVLAVAGLRRLGITDPRIRPIPRELSIPAVGQGAIAIEARSAQTEVLEVLRPLEDQITRMEIEAERAFAQRLGVDCHVPVAAHASSQANGQQLRLDAMVASTTEHRIISSGTCQQVLVAHAHERYVHAQRIGDELAETMINQGAAELIAKG